MKMTQIVKKVNMKLRVMIFIIKMKYNLKNRLKLFNQNQLLSKRK